MRQLISSMIVGMDELQRKVLAVDPAAEVTADEEVTMSEEEKSDDDSDEDKLNRKPMPKTQMKMRTSMRESQ